MEHNQSRRDLLLTPLLMALPLVASAATASPLNPAQTIIILRDDLPWKSSPNSPERSVDMCPLSGDTNSEGLYYTLVRWWPGYMSAPHSYSTDRLCVVVSGTCAIAARTSTHPHACLCQRAVSCVASPKLPIMTA
jgi:hypothetical protein